MAYHQRHVMCGQGCGHARHCADIGPDAQKTVVCFIVAVLRQGLHARRCAKTGAVEVPQIQSIFELVDILFGNRDRYAQCKLCDFLFGRAVSVWQQRHERTVPPCILQLARVGVSWTVEGSFGGPAHRCRADGGSCPQGHDSHN